MKITSTKKFRGLINIISTTCSDMVPIEYYVSIHNIDDPTQPMMYRHVLIGNPIFNQIKNADPDKDLIIPCKLVTIKGNKIKIKKNSVFKRILNFISREYEEYIRV